MQKDPAPKPTPDRDRLGIPSTLTEMLLEGGADPKAPDVA
jgi:hypothetical protein